MASRVEKDDSTAVNEAPKETLFLEDGDLVALKYLLPKRATRGFQTDTEISAGAQVNTDRQLTAFVHDEDPSSSNLTFSLNDRSHESGSWNQFEANQGMLNTSIPQYREDLYTTPLDRNSADYKAKIAEATRIAAEIESKATTNIHQAEERGQVALHDDTMDEEDRYSMVLGPTGAPTSAPPARAKGSYVPPALRDQQQQGDAPPGIAKGSKTPQNQQQGAPGRSSSPRLSGLNLASDAAPNANNNKAFTPYSSDPNKNPTPNPATRTEDTAKLRQSSTDLDDKVKKADSSSSTGSAASKKDMRAFMSATAWVAPTQRKGQEILEGMGMGSGSSSPAAAHSPTPTPTATNVNNAAPTFPVPAAGPQNSPQFASAAAPPHLAGHQKIPVHAGQQLPPHIAAQLHNAAQGHMHMMSPQQQHLMHAAAVAQQHQQQQQQQPTSPAETPAPGSFASLLRQDVVARPTSDIYREILRDTIQIEQKSDWERKQAFPGFAYPYGANPAAYGFHPQAVPGAPLMMHTGHFVAPVNFVQPPFTQPHQ